MIVDNNSSGCVYTTMLLYVMIQIQLLHQRAALPLFLDNDDFWQHLSLD